MIYTGGFLKFGYTATYNLLDYLESINKINNGLSTFYASKEYLAMPVYKDIPLGSLGSNNIYIDSNGITQSSTTGNKILFGEGLKLEWESIFLNTFVDVSIYQPDAGNTFNTERLLVMNKYKIENIDNLGLNAYVIEFHKKINFELNTSFNDGTIDIISRRSLLKISEDLQELNNIHKSKLSTKNIVNDTFGYKNYQRELNFKISTDSYAKIFLSDVDTIDSLTAIMYIDYKNELAMNITKLDRDYNIRITNTVEFNGQLFITCSEKHMLSKDDGVVLEFDGGLDSSQALNQNYFGYRVVTQVYGEYDFTVDLPYGNEPFVGADTGYVRYIKKDPFLNYQPVDLIDIGVNKKGSIAIELGVENTQLKNGKFGLKDVDFSKYRFRLVDGMNIETLSVSYPWILEAEVSGAVIGLNNEGLVWYKGIWEGGRWFNGTWISGTWKLGDWYGGTWKSKMIKDKKISVEIDEKSSDVFQSTWYSGRWFDGTWDNGTWINGRFYDGNWNNGIWNNGTWNDGTWNSGKFIGGIWVTGEWNGGIFNTDNEPAYWIDGVWNGGDFENGMWYNGSFESKNKESRFGTKAFNSRTATWHGGKWLSGSFFSRLGTMVDVSEVHKYSIWRTGQWMSGNFYGGIAYNIDFKSGTWHGGVLEDIQIIGMNENNNSFILNGIFKFNIGDEFYVLNNNEENELSLIFGSNDDPKKYVVLYTVEDSVNKFTEVYVATNISEFSGNYISYRKFSNQFETLSTNSIVTNTIITDNVKETVSDVKVRLNIEMENKLIEKYVPVAQYISTSPIIPVLNQLTLILYPGVPLQNNTGQTNFFSQNLIGVRLSNTLGSVTLNWGINPTGYAGPGFSSMGTPLKYKLNTTMSSTYGSTYIAKESILDAVTREELSSVNITSNTLYSINDEIYGYRIDISEDHLFTTYFAQYEVGVKYEHVVKGLTPNKYYYFRVMELKSSGIGGLRIRLTSPNGQIIGIKEFNEGNDDTIMRDTNFTYNQSFPNFNSGKPVYEGKYKMNLDTIGNTCKLLTSEDLTDHSLISKNNYADFTNLTGTKQYVNGNWTILIENTSGINVGYLYEWEIQFGYTDTLGAQLNNRKGAIDTGLRVVSNFDNANWKTGIWTNGVFNDGLFEAGIWYNGVFNGTWG
jgi:subtilisin-like proprotein convertase family protein